MQFGLTSNVRLFFVAMLLIGAALVPASSVAAPPDLGFDVRFTGVIMTIGKAGTPWVIGSQTLFTDADTQVILTTGQPPAVGMWAEVTAKRQADASLLARTISVRPEQVRLRGVVLSKPDSNIGDWVIAGVTVSVTSDTAIGSRGGSIGVGEWVEAVMTEDAGVLTAVRIIGTSPQDFVTISGEIQRFSDTSWTISAINVAVEPFDMDSGEGTLISGTPVVGLIAHGVAELREDGSLLARGLRVAWIDLNALLPRSDFTGVIEQLPPSGFKGEWIVSGQKVIVMPNTRIHQDKGLAVVGALVYVVGWQAVDRVVATEITVLESPAEGGQYLLFAGMIEALPAGCSAASCLGVWTVGGERVEVNERTLVQGVPEVGKTARLDGVRRASDNVIVALNVRVRALPPPAQTVVPTVTVTVTPPPRPTRPPRP